MSLDDPQAGVEIEVMSSSWNRTLPKKAVVKNAQMNGMLH